MEIPRRLQRRRNEFPVTGTVQRDSPVTQPGRGRRCTGLGTLEYEPTDHGRLFIKVRGRNRQIRGIGCDELAATPVLEQKRTGRIRHEATLVRVDAY